MTFLTYSSTCNLHTTAISLTATAAAAIIGQQDRLVIYSMNPAQNTHLSVCETSVLNQIWGGGNCRRQQPFTTGKYPINSFNQALEQSSGLNGKNTRYYYSLLPQLLTHTIVQQRKWTQIGMNTFEPLIAHLIRHRQHRPKSTEGLFFHRLTYPLINICAWLDLVKSLIVVDVTKQTESNYNCARK